MTNHLTILLGLAFGSSALFVVTIHHFITGKKRDLAQRLKTIENPADSKEKKDLRQPDRYMKILSSVAQRAIKINVFKKIADTVNKNLTAADIPLRSEEYVVVTATVSLLGGLLAALFSESPMAGLLAMLLILFLSNIWLIHTKNKRLNKFNAQIGDALVIISNSLRSGFSFLQAMDMVRKELPEPISKEFGRTFQEMSLGMSTEEALKNLNTRLYSEDMDLVITAVLIQRQIGGNLSEILDNIATTIRERVRIKREIKTLTAQGKISGIIIGILPLLLGAVLLIISPDYLALLITDPLGQGLLVYAVVMEIVGIFLIKRIIDIKV